MALNEATLPLTLYRKVKTIEHLIVRTSRHISIPCFIIFSASAIPTPFFIFKTNTSVHACMHDQPTIHNCNLLAMNMLHFVSNLNQLLLVMELQWQWEPRW